MMKFDFAGLYPPNSPFGVLQMEAVSNPAPLSRTSSPSLNKRRASSDDEDEESPANKRVRTTIQPEQLDYLYQQYKTDSNPSRKQLEMIATKTGKDFTVILSENQPVAKHWRNIELRIISGNYSSWFFAGLKKRVVQVWYQNTRARERKGQLHLQQLSINKRCPVCRLHFKVRSALESHISVKHADIYCKGDVNIEDLPDTDSESYDGRSNASTPLPAKTKAAPLAPSITSLPDMKQCMKQYYDDVKRYLQPLPVTPNVSVPSHPTPASCQLSQPPIGTVKKALRLVYGLWWSEFFVDNFTFWRLFYDVYWLWACLQNYQSMRSGKLLSRTVFARLFCRLKMVGCASWNTGKILSYATDHAIVDWSGLVPEGRRELQKFENEKQFQFTIKQGNVEKRCAWFQCNLILSCRSPFVFSVMANKALKKKASGRAFNSAAIFRSVFFGIAAAENLRFLLEPLTTSI